MEGYLQILRLYKDRGTHRYSSTLGMGVGWGRVGVGQGPHKGGKVDNSVYAPAWTCDSEGATHCAVWVS